MSKLRSKVRKDVAFLFPEVGPERVSGVNIWERCRCCRCLEIGEGYPWSRLTLMLVI